MVTGHQLALFRTSHTSVIPSVVEESHLFGGNDGALLFQAFEISSRFLRLMLSRVHTPESSRVHAPLSSRAQSRDPFSVQRCLHSGRHDKALIAQNLRMSPQAPRLMSFRAQSRNSVQSQVINTKLSAKSKSI